MEDFVRRTLTEWGLGDWIKNFNDEGVDEESFYCLESRHIIDLITKVGPRAKFEEKLRLLKIERAQAAKSREGSAGCSTSAQDENKSPLKRSCEAVQAELQGESSRSPSKKSRLVNPSAEKVILSKVKKIMADVHNQLLCGDTTSLNTFLRDKISELETEKRELVGVFGRTGAGKSSLINAIIEEKNLLPSGSVSACTTVMIKVEANTKNQNYEAEIEFITKEEWKQDLWFLFTFILNGTDLEGNEDHDDAVEMLSALYGDEWEKNRSPEGLCHDRYFREIPEFIRSRKKIFTSESTKELSAKLVKYTRSGSKREEGTGSWYWPLVKCVTVKVPNNDLLQHVTLVDLPGSGDRNKSRDKMWKGVVESCSTVWIVTDINRAASEKETWEILKSASSLMGNGGQCQQIHFICTKSDVIEDSDELSSERFRADIFKRNNKAKEEVKREFRRLNKKQFSDECFEVFTVSSKEFQKKKRLRPEETEIPKLQEFLQNLNDCHSETLNYVSGAYGILSLIQGASCPGMAGKKTDACRDLEEKLCQGNHVVLKPMFKTCEIFEKCLTEGVAMSKRSWENTLKHFLYPRKPKRAGFYSRLKCLVVKNGVYTPKKGKQLNLNVMLASWLSASIDEEFKKAFPNESKSDPLSGAISSFTLDTEKLIEKHNDVRLQLEYLRTEEEKLKTKLDKMIRVRKKEVYNSLTGTIEEVMQTCYEDAKHCTGKGSLDAMRNIIKQHVRSKKDYMFAEAQDTMLSKLNDLMEDILKTLDETMQNSIDLSLKTDEQSLPDVKERLQIVRNYYTVLKTGSPKGVTPVCVISPGPSATQKQQL